MRSKADGDAGTSAERLDAAARTAGALAHEFANVLGTVHTMTSVLREEIAEGSDLAADLEIIAGTVEAGEALLRDLRAFVHSPGLGEGTAELGEVAHAVLAEVGATPGHRKSLSVTSHGSPLRVRADRDRLRALVSRLAHVLLEELPVGDGVCIHVRPDPEGLGRGFLVIECRGLELERGLVARLFEPFAVGKAHRAGLALPAVYTAVTKAGGIVAAETSSEVGLTIRLGLPLDSGDADAPRVSSP